MEKKTHSPGASQLQRMIRSKGFILLVLTIALGLLIGFGLSDNFFSKINFLTGIFIPMVVPGILIVAVGPLLIGGAIDLSTAAQAAFASVLFAKLLEGFPGMSWPVAFIIVMLSGVGYGLINTFLSNVLNIMPFIATIGMSSVYLGFAQWWTIQNPVQINNPAFAKLRESIDLGAIAIPPLFILLVVLIALYACVLSYTRAGRSIYMCGGNPSAARLAGMNPKKVRAGLFINSGMVAALAGIAFAAQMQIGHAQSLVTDAPNLTALTAIILGGIAFTGGSGGVVAGTIGLLFITVFDNGINILAQVTRVGGKALFGNYINATLSGLILIIALMLDYVSTARRQRALVSDAMKRRDKRQAAAKAAEG